MSDMYDTPVRRVSDGPGRFETFTDSARFIPRRLGEFLRDETPVAWGGQQLYVYRNGVYRPGERELERRAAQQLGDSFSAQKVRETVGYLRTQADELLDRPPLDRLNVQNGILDLATGEIGPHDPALRTPVQIGAAYNPDARCPAIERFLEGTLPADAARLFIEIAGYLMVPDMRQQRAVMLLGPGGNGKSVALDVLTALVGSKNVASVPLHLFEEDRFATADLYGRLVNVFGDLDARALKTSSVFKSITGGDRIRAERKNRDAFEFWPFSRLVFSANATPPTHDSSQAYFDRWLVLPFERRFRGATGEDRNLRAKLTTPEELSGLLNLAVAGLRDVWARGFSPSASADRAAVEFRSAADSVAGFIEDEVEFVPEARTPRSALYAAYRCWCDSNGRQAVSTHRFTPRVRELAADRGVPVDETKSGGIRCWLHIAHGRSS